jgi:hypothetical protein
MRAGWFGVRLYTGIWPSFLPTAQTGSGAHPAYYSRKPGFFPAFRRPGSAVRHSHLVPRLRMCGALPLLPCMTWTGTDLLLPTRAAQIRSKMNFLLLMVLHIFNLGKDFFCVCVTMWRMLCIQCMAGHVRNKCSDGCLSFQLPHMIIGCRFPAPQLQIWAGAEHLAI